GQYFHDFIYDTLRAACMVEEERRDMSYPRRAYLIIKLLRLRAACIEEEERRDMSYPRRAVKKVLT
ncbi:33281_t:CDS:1, partial [Gigaspora margarita]